MSDKLSDLYIKLSVDGKEAAMGLDEFRKAMGITETKVRDVGESANRASQMFANMTGAMLGIGKSVLQTAASFQGMEFQLKNIYSKMDSTGAKAKETMEWIKQMAVTSPFEAKDLTEAAVKLEVLGNDTKAFLPLANDLASYMGTDVVEAAQAMSKALAGSPEGWESLRNNYGITADKLKEFNAVLNAQGGIAYDSKEAIIANGAALKAFIEQDMKGSAEKFAETYSGKMSSLEDAITSLKASLGEGLIPGITGVTVKLTDLVDKLNSVSTGTKSTIANIGLGVISFGLLGTAAIKARNFLKDFGDMGKDVVGGLGNLKTGMDGFAQKAQYVGMNIKSWLYGFGIVSGQLTAVAAGFAAVGVAAAAMAIATSQAIFDANKKAFELQQALQSDVSMANKAIGVMDAYNLKGKSVQEATKAFKEMNFSKEGLAMAISGTQQLYAGAKTEEEKKKYEELRQVLRAVNAEYNVVGKTVSEQIIEKNEVTARTIKEIDHNLSIGAITAKNALDQYSGAINDLKNQLAELTRGTKEYNKVQDALMSAEKKAYDLRQKLGKDSANAKKKANQDEKKEDKDYLQHMESNISEIDRKLNESELPEDEKKKLAKVRGVSKLDTLKDREALNQYQGYYTDIKAKMAQEKPESEFYRAAERILFELEPKIKALKDKIDGVTSSVTTATDKTSTSMNALSAKITDQVTPALDGLKQSASKSTQSTQSSQTSQQSRASSTKIQKPAWMEALGAKAVNELPSTGLGKEALPYSFSDQPEFQEGYEQYIPSLIEEMARVKNPLTSSSGSGNVSYDAISPAEYNRQLREMARRPAEYAKTARELQSRQGQAETERLRKYSEKETIASGASGMNSAEAKAIADYLKGQKLQVDVTVNGQKTSNYNNGEVQVKAATQTNYNPEAK